MKTAEELQKEYYIQTATDYDEMHVAADTDSEHGFALTFLSSVIEDFNIKSILDVGSGTGRALLYLKRKHPNLKIVGIEPVKGLREQGYKNGLLADELLEGNGLSINLENNSFDMVCEFGVLHHISEPDKMVSEMLRVAKVSIFISDCNNFGSGSNFNRVLKQTINKIGLWKFYDFIRTKGKMYHSSKEDGIFYSYSVFNNYKQIKSVCSRIHLLNTKNSSTNFYNSATHVALLAFK